MADPGDFYRRGRSPPLIRAVPLDEFGRELRPVRAASPEARPKRRRSPSPLGPPLRAEFDRFPPPDSYSSYRPYRDDHLPSRPYSGPPPRGGGYGPPPPRRPRRPPPEDLPYLVSRDHFMDHIEDRYPEVYNDRKQLEETWQTYRNQFFQKLNHAFFEDHANKAWFKEKYSPDPELVAARRAIKARGRQGRVEVFLQSLEAGHLDDLSLEWPEPAKKEADTKTDDAAGAAAPVNGVNGQEADKRDDQLAVLSPEKEFVIKAVPPDMSRRALEEHCAQAPGFDYLVISDPNVTKRLQRVAFAVFKADADMEEAEKILFESKIGEFTLHMNRTQKSHARIKILPGLYSETERIEKDLEQAQRLLHLLESETGDTRASEAVALKITAKKESQGEDKLSELVRFALDLHLECLRQVFNTCYYCTAVCSFAEELSRKCVKHVRRTDARKEGNNTRLFDDKIRFLLEPDKVDVKEHGLGDFYGALYDQCKSIISVEEDGAKFRCKATADCQKLFKAPIFISKHIANKHPTEVNLEALSKIQYLNNFLLDPCHVLPELPEPGDRRPPPPLLPERPLGSFTGPMNGIPPRPFGDRLSDRIDGPSPSKRSRREPLEIPDGVRPDPRASRTTSYRDLDNAAPAGDLELNY